MTIGWWSELNFFIYIVIIVIFIVVTEIHKSASMGNEKENYLECNIVSLVS